MKRPIYIKSEDKQKFLDYIELNRLVKIKTITQTPSGDYQILIQFNKEIYLDHLVRFMNIIL